MSTTKNWVEQGKGASFAYYHNGGGVGVIFPGVLKDGQIVQRSSGKFSAMHRAIAKPQVFDSRRKAEKFIESAVEAVDATYSKGGKKRK